MAMFQVNWENVIVQVGLSTRSLSKICPLLLKLSKLLRPQYRKLKYAMPVAELLKAPTNVLSISCLNPHMKFLKLPSLKNSTEWWLMNLKLSKKSKTKPSLITLKTSKTNKSLLKVVNSQLSLNQTVFSSWNFLLLRELRSPLQIIHSSEVMCPNITLNATLSTRKQGQFWPQLTPSLNLTVGSLAFHSWTTSVTISSESTTIRKLEWT